MTHSEKSLSVRHGGRMKYPRIVWFIRELNKINDAYKEYREFYIRHVKAMK